MFFGSAPSSSSKPAPSRCCCSPSGCFRDEPPSNASSPPGSISTPVVFPRTGKAMSGTPLFDVYADSYDEALDHALAVTGLAKDFFCQERMTWLRQCLMALGERPRRGLDYGCGNGSSTPLLASMLSLGEVLGVDVSPNIIAVAR